MVGGRRFELRNPKEQIYSLPRLATSLTTHLMASPLGVEPRTADLEGLCSIQLS